MKKLLVTFLMTYALLIPFYTQAQHTNGGTDVHATTQNNQSVIQADSIRKPSNGQNQNVEHPQVRSHNQTPLYNQAQGQNYPTHQYVDGQVQYYEQPVQAQVYYVQPQVQYYDQPYMQGQSYYVDEQGRSYPQQNRQGQVYYAQPNTSNEGYVSSPNETTTSGEGQWYSADTYPQAPIFKQSVQACPCPDPQVKPPKAVTCCSKNWRATLELRVADFYPLNGTMRRIYDCGIPFYQVEASYSQSGPVSAWLNAGYLGKRGRSIGEEDRTYLRLVPIGFGLKYSFYLPYCWQGYVGAGPAYSFLTIHDHSDFNHHIRREALGAMAKLGFTYEFWKCAFLDIFVDYYYTEFKFSGNRNCIRRNDLDASALIFGAGLGWNF